MAQDFCVWQCRAAGRTIFLFVFLLAQITGPTVLARRAGTPFVNADVAGGLCCFIRDGLPLPVCGAGTAAIITIIFVPVMRAPEAKGREAQSSSNPCTQPPSPCRHDASKRALLTPVCLIFRQFVWQKRCR